LRKLPHALLFQDFADDLDGIIAIDGKALRRSFDKTSKHTRYYLLSKALPAERFLSAVRAHWSIENSLHWVLDVTMNGDALRNRTENGPENLALMRRIALNIARQEPSKGSVRGKIKQATMECSVHTCYDKGCCESLKAITLYHHGCPLIKKIHPV